MKRRMTLTPAYGRDFKNKAEIRAALIAERDFIGHDGDNPAYYGYVNLQQMPEMEIDVLNVRYSKLTKVAVFNVEDLLKLQAAEIRAAEQSKAADGPTAAEDHDSLEFGLFPDRE